MPHTNRLTPAPAAAPAAAATDGKPGQAALAPAPAPDTTPAFNFDNRYAQDLTGLYARQQPAQVPAPLLVKLNHALAAELGLDAQALDGDVGAQLFSGNRLPPGAEPLAQAYAGHQFGGFSPQLGDGRALLLGELVDRQGQRRDLALKGSGRTPFSRGGDGKAALGPVLREYLMGEAMHALGVPTTRALAAVTTGESVLRDAGALPGAVLARVAASHIRVGTFQWAASQDDLTLLQRLAHHTLWRHPPPATTTPNAEPSPQPLGLQLLRATAERQAQLVAQWMALGFIHGVMNTDNMTLSGETIDYGPCAFMDAYDPSTVFSSIDRGGRYAYGQQPHIARWNLARLAEALLPLIDDEPQRAIELATEVINDFPALYQRHSLAQMRRKLGLLGEAPEDQALLDDLLHSLAGRHIDWTGLWLHLTDLAAQAETGGAAEPAAVCTTPSSQPAVAWGDQPADQAWLQRWHARAALQPAAGSTGTSTTAPATAALPSRATRMRAANPVYIPRNHLVEAALDAAVQQQDMQPFNQLLAVLQQPFEARPKLQAYAQPGNAAQMAGYRTYCGT